MLKELFDKGKCALGFHIGEWRYLKDRQCEQIQVCSRCKNESRQVVHGWRSWEYLASGACEMARRCGRCNEEETKTEHVWSAPVYESAASCIQLRPCSRCGQTSSAGTAHVWNSWSYEAQGQCGQVAACSRCGATGTERRLSHDWGEWRQSKFYAASVRVCTRCGEMIFGLGADENANRLISLQMVSRAVEDVMRTTDVEGMRQKITQHRAVLFSPVTEKYFNFAVDQLAGNSKVKDSFLEFAGVIERCRKEGVDQVFSPPPSAEPQQASAAAYRAPPPTSGNTNDDLDQRLIGHWRSTEILGSGAFMMATDTHCVLEPSGRMQWFIRTGSGTREPESGVWSSADGTLNLKFDDGKRLAFVYVLQGSTMFCPREGRYRLWERVN